VTVSGKTIALDNEAYAILAKAKRPGETFSDVVKRTVQPRLPLASFAGSWKDIPAAKWKEIETSISATKKKDEERQALLDRHWRGA
jgi:predicted CopG family antitoxin